jgi:polysaccharide biosynthesis PFTS motif protein
MFISFAAAISGPIRKVKRSRLRRMMRGYRNLKHSGRLELIEDSIQLLRSSELPIDPILFSNTLWGSALDSAEIVVRQRLSSKYLRLQESILIASDTSDGLIAAPIPRIWCKQLERLGFRVDRMRCMLLWQIEVLSYLLYGIVLSIIELILSCPCLRSNKPCPIPYVYFCDLSDVNLPGSDSAPNSFCITNWYIDSHLAHIPATHIRHSVPHYQPPKRYSRFLRYQKSPIPNFLTTKQWFLYLCLLVRRSFSIALSSVTGRWWNIIIYPESVISLRAYLISADILAREYWFHNSRFYPPLWTYELKRQNSKSLYYFYGINIFPFPRNDGSTPFNTPYSIMNWSSYLLWNKQHEYFLSRCSPHAFQSSIVGPVPFSDVDDDIHLPYGINIAVFDVSPVRDSFYQRLALSHDIYTPFVVEKFYRDITQAASMLNCNLLVKSKRHIGKLAHPRYLKLLKELDTHPFIYKIDPGVSPFKLIKKVDIVISLPFTSTANIAQAEDKPSTYFCPISHKNPAFVLKPPACSVELITNVQTLYQWLEVKVNEIKLSKNLKY